jgi:hypothetical protein
MQQNSVTGERMLEILLNGVSTRRYGTVSTQHGGACSSSTARKLCARP